jgi:aminoglycoside phosphotransferase (APT) family kinase protein
VVLRIAPPQRGMLFYERNMMAQEPAIHALLREKTSIPGAEILAYDDSHALIDHAYMVMQRLPGRALCDMPGVSTRFYDRVLVQVGGFLQQMHALTAQQYGYLGAHHPMEPQATWWEAFRAMWNALLDDVQQAGGYSAAEADALRQLLDAHRQHLDRPVPASLLHMDVWSQNILVDENGTVTGIVDMDRALWGDPEIEFAVLDYCGTSEEPFWEGYGKERDNSPEARIRHGFYLLYELQKYIFIRKVRSGSSKGADAYRRQSLEMAANLFA